MADAENCPPKCDHSGFHYCGKSGTHCDKHCVCACNQCEADRKDPNAPFLGIGIVGGEIALGLVDPKKS